MNIDRTVKYTMSRRGALYIYIEWKNPSDEGLRQDDVLRLLVHCTEYVGVVSAKLPDSKLNQNKNASHIIKL